MRQELMEGKSPGADGTVSKTGWSNTDVFMRYIEEHFFKYAPGRGDDPILPATRWTQVTYFCWIG
jgi:hypothetical protein